MKGAARFRINDYEKYKVSVPIGICRAMAIEHFWMKEGDAYNIRLALQNRPMIPPGRWTKLVETTGLHDETIWMSDVPAEMEDHGPFYNALFWAHGRLGGRVLINGLGLGMCLQQALRTPWVTHVDVVEMDDRVISLVGLHYAQMAAAAGKTLVIHADDAYTIKFPVGSRWDVIWHDIWPTIDEDNLPLMAKLKRRYAQRCDWQGCWSQQMAIDARSGKRHREHEKTVARFYEQMGIKPRMMMLMEEQARADHARRMEEKSGD